MALLAKLADTASVSARDGAIPDAPGVYAVYNADGALQYMGLSRKVAASVELHRQDLPEECATVKVRPHARARRGWHEHALFPGARCGRGQRRCRLAMSRCDTSQCSSVFLPERLLDTLVCCVTAGARGGERIKGGPPGGLEGVDDGGEGGTECDVLLWRKKHV